MSPSSPNEIVVYWRPGCGFCSHLRKQLDANNITHRLVNIWDDPAAAEHVRSVAKGNETVPTVTIGPVSLVNPSVQQVVAAAHQHAPGLVPEGLDIPKPRGIAKVIQKILGGG